MTNNSVRPEMLRKDVEHTSGPFGGGIAVTAWKATHEADEGKVDVRLITLRTERITMLKGISTSRPSIVLMIYQH